jgi:hypothetical protein
MLETMGGKQMMRALSDAGDNVTEAAIMLGCAREIVGGQANASS